MATLVELKIELKPYQNTLVIDGFEIVRLVDVIDGGDDYYWVYDSHKGIYWSTCVGGWIPLKGFIDQEKYDNLVRVWNLNNIEKVI